MVLLFSFDTSFLFLLLCMLNQVTLFPVLDGFSTIEMESEKMKENENENEIRSS